MPEELEKRETDAASHRRRMVIGVGIAVLVALIVVGVLQYQKIRRDSANQARTGEESPALTESQLLQRLQKLDEETKDEPRLSRQELEARLKALDASTKNAPQN